ncbi:hypothetical protein ATCC90586_002950 [Pythium insidiosum]|nr:hypothetical protein ATCC90586_002950 [Pythium insidiosum]
MPPSPPPKIDVGKGATVVSPSSRKRRHKRRRRGSVTQSPKAVPTGDGTGAVEQQTGPAIGTQPKLKSAPANTNDHTSTNTNGQSNHASPPPSGRPHPEHNKAISVDEDRVHTVVDAAPRTVDTTKRHSSISSLPSPPSTGKRAKTAAPVLDKPERRTSASSACSSSSSSSSTAAQRRASLLDSTPPPPLPTSSDLLIGAGMFDITGPAAEVGMFGYAKVGQLTSGIHMRLRARAFVFHHEPTRAACVYVVCDLGMISEWVTQTVISRLAVHPAIPTGTYTKENVMISATHTHCAPGGISHYVIYSMHPPLRGADRQNFECVVHGIVEAIVRAHRNLQPGVIRVATGECLNASVNRSREAYEANPKEERAQFKHDTDKEMTLWRLDGVNGFPIGMINWFAVHPTSMGNWYTLITGDNKWSMTGYYQEPIVTIEWWIPAKTPTGKYRIKVNGDYKRFFTGEIAGYTGMSSEFETELKGMEVQQPAVDDDGERVREKQGHGGDPEEDGAFDADFFASILQKQLIAYNVSWDPLMKALETLAASMTRQQRAQRGNNNAMEELKDQVTELRDHLHRVEREKAEMTETVAALHDQVRELTTQQQHQRQLLDELAASGAPAAAPSENAEPLVTVRDLKNVKQSLSSQLKHSLSAVFGEDFVVSEDDEGEEDLLGGEEAGRPSTAGAEATTDASNNDDTVASEALSPDQDAASSLSASQSPSGSKPSTPSDQRRASTRRVSSPPPPSGLAANTTGVSGLLRTPLPGVPFASDAVMQNELAKLREQQAALEEKLRDHDEQLGRLRKPDVSPRESSAAVDALQRQIRDLKDQQDAQTERLKEQRDTNDKQISAIKELQATVEDISTQQQMMSRPSGKSDGSGGGGAPPMDLSLVFTKIADLRRSTDSSLDQLQNGVKDLTATCESQQAQLDALQRDTTFHDLQRLCALEQQLTKQKATIDRNQLFQDRAKPQLAEWRRGLESIEEKLMQGQCDQELLNELQQMQRNYHRTTLSMQPVLLSSQTIDDVLERLGDDVKTLQQGISNGVIPLPAATVSLQAESTTRRALDDFTTKLQYLDEEIHATKSVNSTTEKKNDPLLKTLDMFREKIESLWSQWHLNWAERHAGHNGEHDADGMDPSSSSSSTGRAAANAAGDTLRDMEMRLMGALRRLGDVESDVERLTLSTPRGDAARPTNAARSEDLVKLRKEMLDEIGRLSATLSGLQTSASNSSLVPVSNRSLMNRSPDHNASGDLLTELSTQMRRRNDVDGRFADDDDGSQRAMYDQLLKDVTKKVTQSVLQQVEKNGLRVGPAGVGANPNINYRTMLENFTQKVEERLEDAREMTAEELARMRKELMDMIKARLDAAMKDIRAELMIYYPTGLDTNGDSTAMGTKPVMCVACSRPVPVSHTVRDAGAYPPAELIAEQANALLHADLDFDRNEEDFVFRAGFKMPADSRKAMTLPFLANNIRNRVALNKIERKPRRPARQGNRVDNVVREAMELDRTQRYREQEGSPPK